MLTVDKKLCLLIDVLSLVHSRTCSQMNNSISMNTVVAKHYALINTLHYTVHLSSHVRAKFNEHRILQELQSLQFLSYNKIIAPTTCLTYDFACANWRFLLIGFEICIFHLYSYIKLLIEFVCMLILFFIR